MVDIPIPSNLVAYFAHVDSDDAEDRNQFRCLVPECAEIRIYVKKQGWTNFKRHLVTVHKVAPDVLGLGEGVFKRERKSLSTSSLTPKQKPSPKSQQGNNLKDSTEAAKENSCDSRAYGSEEETSGSLHHLRKMKRRFVEAKPQNPPESRMTPEEKMEMLEKTLNTFRSEVDLKLRIIQQILTTRNEQVTVQKRLLDREQNLFTTLLSHWMNAPSLAASGVSIDFSSENQENEYDMDYDYQLIEEDYEPVPMSSTTTDRVTKPKPSRKSQRKRRQTAKAKINPDDHEFADSADSEEDGSVYVDPMDVLENMSDDEDEDGDGKAGEESWNPNPNSGTTNVLVKTEDEGNESHEFEHDSVDATLQKSNAEIPFAARRRIVKLLNEGITTTQGIHSDLIQFGFTAITMTQLNGYLTDLHQRRGAKFKKSYSDPSSSNTEYHPRNS